MTKRDAQAREYAAEALADSETEAQLAARIADFLCLHKRPRCGAYVISWQDQAARLHARLRQQDNAMQELLVKYYALRDKPREFDREGKPPAESSD